MTCCKDKPKHDFTKPGYYRARSGDKVYVIGMTPQDILAANGQRIIGMFFDHGGSALDRWSADGRWDCNDLQSSYDLIEPWTDPVVIEGWVNVYKIDDDKLWIYSTREAADRVSSSYARIDCRKIRYTQGVGIVDITEEG